jgi:AcrR family transcriptional regulator
MPGQTRSAKRAATAQRILEAAREEFAAHGFEGATIRAIGDRAGVHASLVMQHYGTKAALFGSAVQLPADSNDAVEEHLRDVLDVRVGELPPETRALVRSMLTVPEAGESMREYLDERARNLATSLEGEDAELRAALIVSSILGLTVAQHFLELHAFEGYTPEQIARAAHAAIMASSAPPGR